MDERLLIHTFDLLGAYKLQDDNKIFLVLDLFQEDPFSDDGDFVVLKPFIFYCGGVCDSYALFGVGYLL